MPGWGWKHLQLVGIGFADAWPGFGSIHNLLDMNLQIHILGSEASATCWNWICRCLVGGGSICNLLELDMQIHIGVNSGRGSIHNLLELDVQMPGQGWKHLQLVGIGFADTYRGELRTWKHLQLAGIGFADAWSGLEASATCWNWICRCLVGVGSICNLLELDLQMPGRGWKHLQLAGIGFADAWSGSEASAIC